MLERLRIQNFKSWQDTGDMAFGSLTGFFGTNSSGKSSILQFLLMLKQTVESSDNSQVLNLGDEHSYVELGTMYDILFMHRDPESLSFSFDWKAKNLYSLTSEFWHEGKFYFSAKIERNEDYVQLVDFRYQNKNNITEGRRANMKSKNNNPIYELHAIHGNYDSFEMERLVFESSKFYGVMPGSMSHVSNIEKKQFGAIGYSVFELEDFFRRTNYLGPLREYPSRLYTWAGEQTRSVGNRGERAIAALLSSRNQGPTIDVGEGQPKRTVEEHVAYWLKELGLIYSFKVQPIAPNRKEYEVRIQRTAESASVFLTDVGFGVSQILPVLVLLFYVPEGSTVILEQPEIHLHPAVQAGLADVFIDAIKRRKVQIILESHSEHLLQRLQRRIAEEIISQEEIKLYFTSIEEGKSKLTTLKLDEYGNISNWPKGFFGDAFAEAAAKTKAEMKRKMRQQ
ncbi:MAG: DUF3696 domain-containing protein [Janthinobacterium lividum]